MSEIHITEPAPKRSAPAPPTGPGPTRFASLPAIGAKTAAATGPGVSARPAFSSE